MKAQKDIVSEDVFVDSAINITYPPNHNTKIETDVKSPYIIALLTVGAFVLSVISYCLTAKFILGSNIFDRDSIQGSSSHSDLEENAVSIKPLGSLKNERIGAEEEFLDYF